MRKSITKRIAIAALLVVPLAAASTGAEANNHTNWTYHATCPGCSGHRAIVYEGSWTGNGKHYHQYKHDVPAGADHHPWKRIS